MTDILSFTKTELASYLSEMGQENYKTEQIFSWLHDKRIKSFKDMTDISKQQRGILEEKAYIEEIRIEKKIVSNDGTTKYLFGLKDNNYIESVALYYKHGVTLCISSQVGCARGCSFCASGIGGLVRNLTAAEMLLQIYMIAADLNIRVSNVVLMGIGEPLDNFCNVMRFCDIIGDEKGMNISSRSVTISTSGVVEKIDKLTSLNKKYTITISLHAATDELRNSLMPINEIYGLKRLIESCNNYIHKTKRRITFEYAVIEGINDSDADAKAVYRLLKGMNAHINLIPVNSISSNTYLESENSTKRFKAKLDRFKLNSTVRRTLGNDIDASCGQLRRSFFIRTDEERKQ